MHTTLLGAVSELIEHRHAVGFGPDADFARFHERLVDPYSNQRTVIIHRGAISFEVDSQIVPYVGGHRKPPPHLHFSDPINGLVDGDVVFKRIEASDVVIVRVFDPPDEAARLVLLTGDCLDLYLRETVLKGRAIQDANWIDGRCRVII